MAPEKDEGDLRHLKPVGDNIGWHLLRTTYLFQSRWHNLRQDRVILPNGQEIDFTYQEHSGFVLVVPMVSDDEVALIRSYRYPVDAWSWEVPAGGLGTKPGESPEDVARDELAEEIGGIIHGELVSLGSFFGAVGTSDAVGHFFLAWDVRFEVTPHRECTEFMQVHVKPYREALSMVSREELRDAQSALALFLSRPYILDRQLLSHHPLER